MDLLVVAELGAVADDAALFDHLAHPLALPVGDPVTHRAPPVGRVDADPVGFALWEARGDLELGMLLHVGLDLELADVRHADLLTENAVFQPLGTPVQEPALPVRADAGAGAGVGDVEEVAVDAGQRGVVGHHVEDGVTLADPSVPR